MVAGITASAAPHLPLRRRRRSAASPPALRGPSPARTSPPSAAPAQAQPTTSPLSAAPEPAPATPASPLSHSCTACGRPGTTERRTSSASGTRSPARRRSRPVTRRSGSADRARARRRLAAARVGAGGWAMVLRRGSPPLVTWATVRVAAAESEGAPKAAVRGRSSGWRERSRCSTGLRR